MRKVTVFIEKVANEHRCIETEQLRSGNKHNALTFSVPAIRHTFQTEIITIEQYAQKLLCNRLA